MQPVNIFTEQFFFFPRLKDTVKRILGRAMRGPQAVEKSLVSGLGELGVPFGVNETLEKYESVGVLSGVETLKKMITWKEQGKVGKIIAGPNLVVTPEDYEKIIQHPLIDIVVQPSQWSADFYASLAPSLIPKLRVWPAGVYLPPEGKSEKGIDFLVYNKIGQSQLFFDIVSYLQDNNFSCQVLHYGKFKQSDYFALLERSRYLIYLSESESQGLAMFEAWARGVPSLVWERGYWKYGSYFWQGKTASSYVNEQNGMVFKDFEDFSTALHLLTQATFQPRTYIENGFTYKRSAEKYIAIYQN